MKENRVLVLIEDGVVQEVVSPTETEVEIFDLTREKAEIGYAKAMSNWALLKNDFNKRKPFSVLLEYPQEGDTFFETTWASNELIAVGLVKEECCRREGDHLKPEDMVVLLVLEGHHLPILRKEDF